MLGQLVLSMASWVGVVWDGFRVGREVPGVGHLLPGDLDHGEELETTPPDAWEAHVVFWGAGLPPGREDLLFIISSF